MIKDFQPIHFKYCADTNECNCGSLDCNQVAVYTDKFSFQLENSGVFLSDELLLNGAVWIGSFEDGTAINGGNWTDGGVNTWEINAVAPLSGTRDMITNAFVDSEIVYNTNALTTISTGDHVRFSFEHSVIADGNELEVYYYTAGAPVLLFTLTGLVAAGTYIYNFVAPADITGIGFKHIVTVEQYLQIDDVSIKTYDFSSFKIIDCCDDSVIDTLTSSDFDVTDDNITFIGLWSDYVSSKACYKIVIDDIDLILNGGFDYNLDSWSNIGSDTEWAWSSGTARIDVIGAGNTDELRQTVDLPSKCTFLLKFTLDTNIADFTWYVYVNGVLYDSSDTIGVITVNITSSVPITSIGISVHFSGAGYATLNDIGIEHDIFTDCICLNDEHYFCTTFIEAYNDTDTTQFEFDGDLRFYLRLHSKFSNPTYPTEEEIYLSSAGANSLNYARSEKFYDYLIERIPEYLWDALSTIFMMDNIYIDGIRYVKNPGDIEPKWNRSNNRIASGTLSIKKYLENRMK